MFLSFVVPVYNAAQYLPECLDSLLAQDISDYEIICVNDGSRDASPKILGQYAAEHGNIRVINKENGGVVSATQRRPVGCSGRLHLVCRRGRFSAAEHSGPPAGQSDGNRL